MPEFKSTREVRADRGCHPAVGQEDGQKYREMLGPQMLAAVRNEIGLLLKDGGLRDQSRLHGACSAALDIGKLIHLDVLRQLESRQRMFSGLVGCHTFARVDIGNNHVAIRAAGHGGGMIERAPRGVVYAAREDLVGVLRRIVQVGAVSRRQHTHVEHLVPGLLGAQIVQVERGGTDHVDIDAL